MHVLLYVVIALVAFFTLEVILRRRYLPTNVRLTKPIPATVPTRNLIYYLPGILADGIKSSDPVRKTWLKYGDVVCVDYGTKRFIPEEAANKITTRVINDLKEKRPEKLTFILSSMGGILGLDSWVWIRDNRNCPEDVEMIVVDGIQGGENMLPKGAGVLATVLSLIPVGPMLNPLVTWFLHKGLAAPKDPDIQQGLDKDKVKKDAIDAMWPYKGSIWRDDLAYMARHNDLQKEHFQGLSRVIYVMCMRKGAEKDKKIQANDTVKQPQEMRKWKRACEAAGVEFVILRIEGPHCPYAQLPDMCNRVFDEALSM